MQYTDNIKTAMHYYNIGFEKAKNIDRSKYSSAILDLFDFYLTNLGIDPLSITLEIDDTINYSYVSRFKIG